MVVLHTRVFLNQHQAEVLLGARLEVQAESALTPVLPELHTRITPPAVMEVQPHLAPGALEVQAEIQVYQARATAQAAAGTAAV